MSVVTDSAVVAVPSAPHGHYQLGRLLGKGGCGRVFQAWDSRLQRHVALKQLHAVLLAQGPQLLWQEARLAASLRHPAFVRIFSIDEHDGHPAIVMELVEGIPLSQRAPPRMPLAEALQVVRQVAEAMQEAHTAQLVHGDLKPSNLMCEPSGRVRILDFGLARQIDPLATQEQLSGDIQGTIAYMAPERLLGQPSTPAGDVYALGVLLYELVAGQRPHAQLNGLALAAAHLQTASTHWEFGSEFSGGSAALVRAMTAREPARRLGSMRQVGEQAGALAAAPAPDGRRRPPVPGRRLSAALLLLLALAGAGGWLWQRGGADWPLPDHAAGASAAWRAGMQALDAPDREGNLEHAVKAFRAVLQQQPAHAAAAAGLSLAYSLRYAGDGRDESWLKLADASAQQALSLDPQLALAYAAQAAAWEFQGRHEQALAAGARALQLDPLCTLAVLGRARLLIVLRRHAEAAQEIRAAMLRFPRERRLADLLGTLHYQQGDYRQAELDFRHSLQLQPDAVYAYASLSAVLLHQDRQDEALHLVQQGLALRPDSTLYTNLGNIMFAQGRYVDAATAFEQAVKGNPNNYAMWANLADALRWMPGRTTDARSAYQRACALLAPLLQRAPKHINRTSRMGLYQARLGQYAAALEWTARALAAAPANADVQFRAAIAQELAGRRADAIASLRRAQALGYAANLIDSEPDLVAVRRDPLFHHP